MNKKILVNLGLVLLTTISLSSCSTSHYQDGIYHVSPTHHWFECVDDECDEKYLEEEHSFSEWQTIVDSTCSSLGEEKRTCSVCEYIEKRTIAKKEHTYPTTFVKDELGHYSLCSICGKIKPSSKVEHIYEKWNVIEEATVSKEGLEKATCICGYEASRIIPKVVINAETINIKKPECLKNGAIDISTTSEFDLEYLVNPSNATDVSNLTVTSLNEETAKVENGKVKLLKEGLVQIKATNGVKEGILSFVNTNIILDGNLDDEEYLYYIPDVATSKYAGYNVENQSYVLMGEGGIYLSHSVTDKYISSYSHIEGALVFGDECTKDNTLYVNMYPNNQKTPIRFFNKPTSFDSGKELLGKDSINAVTSSKINGSYGDYSGYDIETFIPYSELEEYGYNSNLEYIRYIPLVYHFSNQDDADKAGLLNSVAGLKPIAAYGNINTLRAKYDTYLIPKFYKDGRIETPNKNPLVEYTFDNGQIVNTGTNKSIMGRLTTISEDNKSIVNIENPNVNYVKDSYGNEGSAVQLSNTRTSNHFTVSGVNLGTGDFTISVKINLTQLTSNTNSDNYLFGIGNKKDVGSGYFNFAYKKNGSKNQIRLRLEGLDLNNVEDSYEKLTKWVGYCPVGEFVEFKLVRKGNIVTFYLEKNEGTNNMRMHTFQLKSTDSLSLNNYDIGFSSNIGCNNPGDWPAYYDDIKIYDYAIPM